MCQSIRSAALIAAASAALGIGSAAGAADFRLLKLDGMHVKWGAPAYGAPAEVTYGFATSERAFPDAINCRDLASMESLGAAWGHDPARLRAIAAQAFAIWSAEAAIRFRPAPPGVAPDILIGAEGEPQRVAFANVWHGPGSGPGRGSGEAGVAPLTAATVCLNPEVTWWGGPGPAPDGALSLRTVLAHEIGHAIGLDHPGAAGALMGYSNQGDIDRLMPGDIAGAVALYGRAGHPASAGRP